MTDAERIRLTLASDAELRRRLARLRQRVHEQDRTLAAVMGRLRRREINLEESARTCKRHGTRIEFLQRENARLRKLVRSLNGEEITPHEHF